MIRLLFFPLVILPFIQFCISISLSPPSLAQEWEVQVKPQGTLMVTDMRFPSASIAQNYAEGLVTLDRDNKWVPCLARDWRWVDDRTIEFKLREGVRFHNGEEFNADAVKINWEAYKRMKSPRPYQFTVLPDETILEVIEEYMVRFIFPEPEGLAFVKFRWFFQIAPAFFDTYEMSENNWGYLPEAGPWGTGPFKLVEGNSLIAKPADRAVLEAFEDYWDPRYPKIKRVVFDNTFLRNREEAMRLCREEEGLVDIVNFIRPLDTLKIAESRFAKVVKSRDVTSLAGYINMRKTESKWKDVRLRKAINYAINREELWKYAAKGNAFNLGGHIPPGEYGHNPELSLYTYDTERARSLLKKAGYPVGFEVRIITIEPWKLETQIISKMLGRIGLQATFDVLTFSEYYRKVYMPGLDNPPEKQDWDLTVDYYHDWYGNTGSTFLTWGVLEESYIRWIEYDIAYEEMWKEMAGTVDKKTQEEKIRQMMEYIYEQAYLFFIYSPLSLYSVNKEVNFAPQKFGLLRLKETSVTDKHWSIREENQ
jgi:peptide/nickel transport system substrate-binding protein